MLTYTDIHFNTLPHVTHLTTYQKQRTNLLKLKHNLSAEAVFHLYTSGVGVILIHRTLLYYTTHSATHNCVRNNGFINLTFVLFDYGHVTVTVQSCYALRLLVLFYVSKQIPIKYSEMATKHRKQFNQFLVF